MPRWVSRGAGVSVFSCPAGALPVIASEAKQSILLAAHHNGLRFARKTVCPEARLRPVGFGAARFALRSCVAAPRVARRAKRGGARRDRTADLLHAMQALSQLSYGPETLSFEHDLFGKPVTTFPDHAPPRAMGDARGKTLNTIQG